jgi:hypothetical protein
MPRSIREFAIDQRFIAKRVAVRSAATLLAITTDNVRAYKFASITPITPIN